MAVLASRGATYVRLPLFHHSKVPNISTSVRSRTIYDRSTGLSLFARYSQAQDFSSRFQDSVDNLPKLVEDIFQTSLNTGPRGALRLAQGIQAVIGVGGEWLTDLSKSANASSGLPMQMQLGLLSPLYLRRLFERMGATYIKLGQFIASAPTLFPPEYVEEFQRCFDNAPAVPFEEIQAILRQELGGTIDSVYEYVDPVPLASASIAQVHSARLRGSQEDVVIKVLKPGIEDVLVADLNFVYVVARILEFLNPELSRASLVAIVKDIKESMLEEVDFKKEAANIESFRRYLESMELVGQATAPKVYPHCSTKRVLTMERLYGVPLTDLDSIRSLVSSPEASLITALNVWFGSLLACETFHADVHAGNLWLLRDGRIGFLDFGIVGRISPKTWAAMEIFLTSLSSEDYEAMASSLVQMGATDRDVDAKAFARDLEKVFSSIQKDIMENLRSGITTGSGSGTGDSQDPTTLEARMGALENILGQVQPTLAPLQAGIQIGAGIGNQVGAGTGNGGQAGNGVVPVLLAPQDPLTVRDAWLKIVERFRNLNAPTYQGSADPLEADKRKEDITSILDLMGHGHSTEAWV